MESLIKLKVAAKILSIHPETLRRWDRSGKLKAIIVSKRGDRRYRKTDLIKFIEK